MQTKPEQRAFRDLDGNFSLPPSNSALEDWYIEVRDTKIADLSDGDLARACRQNEHIEAIVPTCLLRLEKDPQAGALYDGELVVALKELPARYWGTHPDERAQFLLLAQRAYQEYGDEDLYVTEEDLLRK